MLQAPKTATVIVNNIQPEQVFYGYCHRSKRANFNKLLHAVEDFLYRMIVLSCHVKGYL